MESLILSAGAARLELVPAMGGGIARLDVDERPVLRPWSRNTDGGPFELACNILVPFSNRISGGGFPWDSDFHTIEPNLAGEPFPIHGDGFQKAWAVEDSRDDTATLTLEDGAIGPFAYRAQQDVHLSDQQLTLRLNLTNLGDSPLPFGCGFHPWFPRDAETRLSFSADGLWMEDAQHLPTAHHDLAELPDWDFEAPRALPDGLINNAFTRWTGDANIEQGSTFTSATVSASPNLDCAIVYSPDALADFFCFEPVSHAVDAHNAVNAPGLTVLATGQSMTAQMTIAW